jgi:hypothetical protein
VSPPHPDLLDALRLRRWALAALAGAPDEPPTAPPGAWALFLGREACALPLRTRLGAAAPAPIRQAADRELQQVLALRAELADVLAVAGRIGVEPVLLKGTAVLTFPDRTLWAKDLDLLLGDAEARALVTALAAAGWENRGGGNPVHYGDRARPGCPPVEIHTPTRVLQRRLGADVLRDAVPHRALAGARVLAPATHLRHVVLHQTTQHPSHRGRLRDLVLLSGALEKADPPDDIGAWQLSGRARRTVRQTLDAATAIRDRRRPIDPSPAMAAAWYQMDLEAGDQGSGPWTNAVAAWTLDWMAAGGAIAERLRVAFAPRVDDWSWIPGARGLGVRYPRTGRAARFTARLIWLPVVAAVSAVKASRLRARVRAALSVTDERG